MLSNNYGDDLLPVLLPIVQQRLQVRVRLWSSPEQSSGHVFSRRTEV